MAAADRMSTTSPSTAASRSLRQCRNKTFKKKRSVTTLKNQISTKTKNRAYRIFSIFTVVVLMLCFTTTAFAADDPLTVVNNLSDFIFSLIRAVGIILLGFGILQIGLSLKSHDPSQRANGMLTVAGGIVITFSKEILTLITG